MPATTSEIMEQQAAHFLAIAEALKNGAANLPWIQALEIALQNGGDFEAAKLWFLEQMKKEFIPIIEDSQRRTEKQAINSIAEFEVDKE